MKKYKIKVTLIEVKAVPDSEGLLCEEDLESQDVYLGVPDNMDREFRKIYSKTLLRLFRLTKRFLKKLKKNKSRK